MKTSLVVVHFLAFLAPMNAEASGFAPARFYNKQLGVIVDHRNADSLTIIYKHVVQGQDVSKQFDVPIDEENLSYPIYLRAMKYNSREEEAGLSEWLFQHAPDQNCCAGTLSAASRSVTSSLADLIESATIDRSTLGRMQANLLAKIVSSLNE